MRKEGRGESGRGKSRQRSRARRFSASVWAVAVALLLVGSLSTTTASAYESTTTIGYVTLGADRLPDSDGQHRVQVTVYDDTSQYFQACYDPLYDNCPMFGENRLAFIVVAELVDNTESSRPTPILVSGIPRHGCGQPPFGFEYELECVLRTQTEKFEAGESETFVVGIPRSPTEEKATVRLSLHYSCTGTTEFLPCTNLSPGATVYPAELTYSAPKPPGEDPAKLPRFCHAYSAPRGSLLTVPASSGLLAGTGALDPPAASIKLTKISFAHNKLSLSPAGDFRFLASAKTSQQATIEYALLDEKGSRVATGTAYIDIGTSPAPPQGCESSSGSHQPLKGLVKKSKAKTRKIAKKAKQKEVQTKRAQEAARGLQRKPRYPEVEEELYDCSDDGTKCYWMYSSTMVNRLERAKRLVEIKNYCLTWDLTKIVKCDKLEALIKIWNDIATKVGLQFAEAHGDCYGGKETIHTGALGFLTGPTIEDGPNESPVPRGEVFYWPMYSKKHQTGLMCSASGKVVRFSNNRDF